MYRGKFKWTPRVTEPKVNQPNASGSGAQALAGRFEIDAPAHAGHSVRLTGDLNNETIRISKIEMVSAGKQ